MAAAQSSTDSLAPHLRRRPRRLVFDRRYGWIFDEWTHPADQALSGGRGMFCALTMARSLVSAAACSTRSGQCSRVSIRRTMGDLGLTGLNKRGVSNARKMGQDININYAVSSISRVLERPKRLHKKQQAWFRELECSGVVADLKLIQT
ncbi:hypothetical protein ZEAMMB73_Zm00001d019344 [Zea mays]|uniref:Uncharacterized protein n=1 Tax=Zea mays TaxID=4577 RepID=A0A1D6HX06_MAIZE|nr:hypothetical protein ZEAMMB73_Zm00001d019344 [Zea mays]